MNLCFHALLAVAVFLQAGVFATSPADQILRHVLNGYNKDIHPSNDVRLIYQINYLECPTLHPSDGILMSKVHEAQRWKDERLRWNPSSFQQRESVVIPSHDVWSPGVSIDPSNGRELSSTAARLSLSHTGVLHRSRTLRLLTNCDQIDGAWKCQLRFVAWKYAGENFIMTTQGHTQGPASVPCGSDLKVEEFSTHVEQVGAIGNSYYQYVVEMILQPQ